MDATYIYMSPKITTSDTISAVVTNMPEKVRLSEDMMSVYDSLQQQLLISNSKIDSIYSLIQQNSINGWGINQLVSVIAIPLIIAIFAFTLPFVLNVTTKIDQLYQSKAMTQRFNQAWPMLLYKSLLITSMILILFLMVVPKVVADAIVVTLPYITALLVFCVYRFFTNEQKFENPKWGLKKLDDWYKKDSFDIDLSRRWNGIKIWFRKLGKGNNPSAMRVYKILTQYNQKDPYRIARKNYYERLYALLNVAVKTNNISLFYEIQEKWYQKIKETQSNSLKFGYDKSFYFEMDNELLYLYIDAIVLLSQCPDYKFQEAIVIRLQNLFNQGKLPSESDVMSILRTLVSIKGEYGHGMIKKYLEWANRMYSSILSLSPTAYVCGVNVNKKKELEKECRKSWKWICNLHFLLGAYLWNKGLYNTISVICPDKEGQWHGEIFPVSSVEILQRYISAYTAICGISISDWQIGEIFDVSEKEMRQYVIDYAAFLLYYKAKSNKTYYYDILDIEEIRHTPDAISELQQKKNETLIRKACDVMQYDMSAVDFSDTLKEAEKEMMQVFPKEIYHKNINMDIFTEMQGTLRSNSKPIYLSRYTEGIYRAEQVDFTDEESLGIASFATHKLSYIAEDVDEDAVFDIVQPMMLVLMNRYMYAWLSCVSKMQISTIESNATNFIDKVIDYTRGEICNYMIVSFDSSFEYQVHPLPQGMQCAKISRHCFQNCDLTKLFLDQEDTLYVIRKDDLPSLQYEPGYEDLECFIKDESSEEIGDMTVRFEIDPHRVLKYNKSGKVLKIIFEDVKI